MLFGYSKIILPFIAYALMFIAIYFALSSKKHYAVYLTVPLFCLPNFITKLEYYPMGKEFIDIIYVCLFISLVVQGRFSLKIKNSLPIIAYILILTVSFFMVGEYPEGKLSDYKNYMMIPLAYFLIYNTIQRLDHLKILIICMVVSFLGMDRVTYGEYGIGLHPTYYAGHRPGGVFEAIGLGANYLGAFMAEYTMILIGICALVGRKFTLRKMRRVNFIYLFWLTIVGNIYSIMFSFSRGAYVGAFLGLIFLGITRVRMLLLCCVVLVFFWHQVLPNSVVERIEMTRQSETGNGEHLDSASMHRKEIWNYALELFVNNPLTGVGLYNFRFNDGHVTWNSTHNQYLAFLCETGIIGFTAYLLLYFLAFRSGWRLYKTTGDVFLKGLGIGFCACVVSSMASNAFGDRWSVFALQSIYFVFWALVEKGIFFSLNNRVSDRT